MIVDTSALLAVLFREDEAQRFEALIAASSCRMSVANVLEAALVVEGRGGRQAGDALDEFLAAAEIAAAPISTDQIEVAREAWRRYGKGNHPAALNFGDCFAYALARTKNEPLLFKGNDFAQTDIATRHNPPPARPERTTCSFTRSTH